MLACWVDALLEKGVEEPIVFNLLYRDAATVQFPLWCLKTEMLTTLAIAFFDIGTELSDSGWLLRCLRPRYAEPDRVHLPGSSLVEDCPHAPCLGATVSVAIVFF